MGMSGIKTGVISQMQMRAAQENGESPPMPRLKPQPHELPPEIKKIENYNRRKNK